MAYSDFRDYVPSEVGRVYPKPAKTVEAEVRERLDAREHFNRNRRAWRADSVPLVKPAAYKARNEANGSGPSGARS